MNQKNKATLTITLLMTLLALTLVWQGTNQHNNALHYLIQSGEADVTRAITTLEQTVFIPYKTRLKNLLNQSPDIITAFAERDRELLYQTALPKFQALKLENTFFQTMHFHLPDGKTFLRVHMPEFHGDDLTGARPIITAVHHQQQPLSGFEISRSGPLFRVVQPIFKDKVYLGALEFGILAHQTIEMLSMKDNLIITTYFDKKAWKKASLFETSKTREMDNFILVTHGNELFNLLPDNMGITDRTTKLRLDRKSYLMQTKPTIFKNYAGQAIGGIMFLQDISPFVDIQKTFLIKALLLTLFIMFSCFFVVYFYFDKVLGTFLDEITQRRKTEKALRTSESRFRLLVHDLPNIAVQGYDKDRSVVLWNKGSELLYGYSREEAMGRKIEDLIIPENMQASVIGDINSLLDLNIAIPSCELILRHKNGSPVPVFSSHTLFYKSDGDLEIYCVDIDLKDLKEAKKKQTVMEQQLLRAQKMEAIGLMAGGVAHDLNNILSGIVSYPELLLMQLSEESSLREPLETIKESGIRAAAVVSDLLTVARGAAKTLDVANPNNFINTYMRSAEYNELCRCHPHIDVVADLDPGLKNIRCSGVHIMKVITNLVNNSAEAIIEKGTITITSSPETVEDYFALEHDIEPGEYSLISVCDDGPGIPPDDLNRIFEPFFTKKIMGRSGTGLGLAVVWNTMKDHDGVVLAESSEKGSCFKLYFPACDEEITAPVQAVNPVSYQGNNETILVVDDEAHQRLIAKRILTVLGYQVHTAASGEEAVEYMTDHQADLLILDMIMDPGIDGKETYTRILKMHSNQKAIIASGFSQNEAAKGTLALGAGQYIKKPYTLNQMGEAVRRELSPDQ